MAENPSEEDIIRRESGGNPNIGFGGIDLTSAPRDQYGFPIWSGRMGPQGISHAAGLYQFQPGTWATYAKQLGVTDFSPESQRRVYLAARAAEGARPWAASAPGVSPEAERIVRSRTPEEQAAIGTPIEIRGGGSDAERNAALALLMSGPLAPKQQEPQEQGPDQILQALMAGPVAPAGASTTTQGEGGLPQEPLGPLPAPAPPQPPATVPELASASVQPPAPQQRGVLNELLPGETIVSGPQAGMTGPVAPEAKGFLERLMAGPVQAGREFLRGQAEMAGTDYSQMPLLGMGGKSGAGRLPALAAQVVPYLAGGAPGGSLSAGMRIGRGGGNLPARIEPPPLRAPGAGGAPRVFRLYRGENSANVKGGGWFTTDPQKAGLYGKVSYIDVPISDMNRFAQGHGGPDEWFTTDPEILNRPRQSFVGGNAPADGGGAGGGIPPGDGPPAMPPAAGPPGRPTPPPPGPGMVPHDQVRVTTDPAFEREVGKGGESWPMIERRTGIMRQTQDGLYKLWTRAEDKMIEFIERVKAAPKLSGEEKLQLERYMEWQPGMPRVPAPSGDAMRAYEDFIKPSQRRAAADFVYLQSKGALDTVPPEVIDDMTSGYMHRMVANRGKPGEHPFNPFGGVRGMRQRTSSMRERGFVALQNSRGQRVLLPRDAVGEVGYGAKVRRGNEDWEVRRATTEEIESQTDTRYLHDPVMATLQNETQLSIARENFDFMHKAVLPKLKDEGLLATDAETARRLGFRESNIPALRGYYFEDRMRYALNDFYRTPSIINEEMIPHWIGATNRFAISSMFLNPIGHMRNVTADAMLARKSLWAPVAPQGSSWQALKDVWTQSPFYRDLLRNGAPLMGAGARNRAAFQVIIKKVREDMTTLPHMDDIARSTGVWQGAKEMGEAFWNASQKAMWLYHDMLTVARVRELMAQGRGMETAIKEAERFIADYRVPATIGEDGALKSIPKPIARRLSILMQDRSALVFGRYHYNKMKAIANVLRDAGGALLSRNMPLAERKEALSRLLVMLTISTGLQEGINYVVRQATGNQEASAHVPGALGIPANAYKVASDVYRGKWGEAGWDFWMGILSVISPAPMLAEAGSQMMNRDVITGAPIAGNQLPAGEQAVQRGAHLARTLLPVPHEIGRIIEGKGVPSLGISTPDPAAIAKARRPRARERLYQQRKFNRDYPWLR